MAREGITFEQVAAAADDLVGQGKQPTIKAIREALGTGSPNTVHRHLATWREGRPQAVVTASALPASLTAVIAAEIERAAAQARAEIEARLVQAQAEAADLSGAGEALEAERDALVEQVAALTTERDTLAGKAAQQAADIAAQVLQIEREQAAAEAARLEVATARVKIEAQSEQAAELVRLRAALDSSQQVRQQAEQQAAVLAAKLEATIDRLESAAREIEDARAAAKKAGEEAAELRGRFAGKTELKPSKKIPTKAE